MPKWVVVCGPGTADWMGEQKSCVHLHEQREQSLPRCLHPHHRVQEESKTTSSHTTPCTEGNSPPDSPFLQIHIALLGKQAKQYPCFLFSAFIAPHVHPCFLSLLLFMKVCKSLLSSSSGCSGDKWVDSQDKDQSPEPGGPGWLWEAERHPDCWTQTQSNLSLSL